MVRIENLYNALSNEIHFLDITFVTDDNLTRSIKSTIHIDDKLVGKAPFAFIKEVIKGFFKVTKHSGALYQVSLHLRSHLLIEWEIFNYQVEIKLECLFNILSNIVIKSRLNMERLVRFFNLFDPHVQGIQFFFDQILKII